MATMALDGEMAGGSAAEAIDMRGRGRPGLFFRARNRSPLVGVGNRFYRHRPDRMVETATVISVARDGLGIPHVRYTLEIQKLRGSTKFTDGPRSLALETFISTYKAES